MKKLTVPSIDPAVIRKLREKSPRTQTKHWEYTSGYAGKFKRELTKKLETIQANRCAYCRVKLEGKYHHRDHIAPKELHPEYTFTPMNLVLSCYYCNTECKGDTDTVIFKCFEYKYNNFSIVHPYLDNPEEHLEFLGKENQILVSVVDDSPKGEKTIRMFRLDSADKSKRRAMDALLNAETEGMPGRWLDGLSYSLSAKFKSKIRFVQT